MTVKIRDVRRMMFMSTVACCMIDKTRKIRMTCAALVACVACVAAPAAETEPPSLLWKVEASGVPASYVMGTIHLPDTTVFRIRDTILDVFDGCRAFYGELDLDSVQGAMMDIGAMLLPAGKTLRSFYHDTDWVRIDALLKERLGPMAMMTSRLKPSTVLVMVMQKSIPTSAGMTIDEFFWRRAKERGIARYGIERAAEQLDVLDSMPPAALADFAADPMAFDSAMTALRDAYVAERLDLVAEAAQDIDQYEEFAARLNDDRNATMAERLDQEFRTGGVFVAVGAAHLPGPRGLLQVLRDRGFSVAPVIGGERRQALQK